MMSIFYAAVDDTQRMMQMGGFGFDPSKVRMSGLLLIYHSFEDQSLKIILYA